MKHSMGNVFVFTILWWIPSDLFVVVGFKVHFLFISIIFIIVQHTYVSVFKILLCNCLFSGRSFHPDSIRVEFLF